MSDDDFDVELLALAGDGEKRRKKRQNSSSGRSPTAKRRKPVKVESDSDMEPESEDDSNPYPLEGKYIDEADRARLSQMPEIEREELLASRQEELQRLQDKHNLDNMLKTQTGGADFEHVSQAAKRKHAVRGATKEKTQKLDELKAKRKAKEERARAHKDKASSPGQRRRSESSEPELSDVTDEEGEINKEDEEERKYKESFNSPKADKITLDDFEKIRLSRHQIAKNYYTPWFEDWVAGAWVRYLIGSDEVTRQPIYRICEVKCVAPGTVKPYKVNDIVVDRMFDLKHGKAQKLWPIDKVSDSAFTQKEFDRIVQTLEKDKVELPNRRFLEKKAEQLIKLPTTSLTEADITAMVARKSALNPNNVAVSQAFAHKAKLTQERNLALARQDYKEAAQFEHELEELAAKQQTSGRRGQDGTADLMARVNERNRKANLDAVRKAEAEQAIRKRQERKAAAAAAANGGPNPVFDVSARLKTVPKIHHKSRTGTPLGTPKLRTNDSAERSVSPLPPLSSSSLAAPATARPAHGSFEARVVDSINVELDDF
ncbi:plus-3-domain-containing protein [Ramaria rubella]|nr:plus-3-domain-containing protein [Ramaria rubella]